MPRNKSAPFVIGLTGLSGSGKSTVARLLAEKGGYGVDADALAHEVMRRGRPAFDAVADAFGAGILGKDGEIDRRKLGALVFGQPDRLRLLEGILHPLVIAETQARLAQAACYPFAVVDAPLLVEAGMHRACDAVWLVTAREDARKARIVARDSLTESEAAARLDSRGGEEALRPYAHAVIDNNGDGDGDALRVRVHAALAALGL